ncbi:sugar ABC transporter permease [Ruania sp. N2-46]|uniref:Sugar ABC transporter permease n=2 Tax=Occultella gossypii TaxID=2800820 RepID=A0ABS7SHI2_9MICO|nr:sugar ABC transporter permease [Occultella gossypii]
MAAPAPESAPLRRPRTVRQRLWRYKFLYLLFLPVFAYYTIFQYWPILLSFIVSFKDLKLGAGIWGSDWVGFQNFAEIFSDPALMNVFSNTVEISLLRLLFGFLPPIILAILFHDVSSRVFKRITQTIVYIPHFFSWIIVYGIVFAMVATGPGLINNALEWFGGERIEFLLSEEWFRPILIASGVWKEVGWSTIIYLAALATIDSELYDAAALDGAGPLRRIWYVTLPAILPVISFVLTINLGFILYAGGEQILAFYNSAVYDTADVIDTWVYREGLGRLQFSIGTAMGLLQSAVGLVLVMLSNTIARRLTGRGIW